MIRRRRQSEDESVIDMTPMLDVVFIMLIFFITATSFVKESGIDVNRPSAKTAQRKDKVSIIIGINDSGEVWLDNRQIDLRTVRANIEKIRAETPESAVVIQADKQSRTGLLVQVMDQVRLAGIGNISIAATVASD